jgi:hypothetical protein
LRDLKHWLALLFCLVVLIIGALLIAARFQPRNSHPLVKDKVARPVPRQVPD